MKDDWNDLEQWHGRKMKFKGYFRSKAWMDRIAKFRKYKNQAKGEANFHARLEKKDVFEIRRVDAWYRKIACKVYKISERHWYHIRAKQRWSHL